MASLTGSSVASSYKSLLKLNGNTDTLVAGNGSNAIQIVHSDDSTGVTSPLYLNTDRLGIGGQPSYELDINLGSGTAQARINTAANAKTSLIFKNSVQEWEIGNSVGDNNKFTIRDITDSRNAFVIDGSGNIGIGESSSIDKKLHIKSSTSGDGITIENSSTGASVVRFEADSSALRGIFGVEDHDGGSTITGSSGYATFIRSEADIQFASGGNNLAVTIDSSQNVGIGIANPTSGANWSQFLQINHTTNSALVLTETDSTQSCDVATNGAGMFIDVAGHSDASNNVINFRTEDANSAYSPTTRMTISSDGTIEHIGALTQRLYVKHMHSDGTTLSGWVGTGSALGSAGNTDLMLRANNSIYFNVNNSGTSANTRLILDDNSRISLSNNDLNVGSTVFGYNALDGNTDNNSDRNTAIGHGALDGIGSTTASDNIAIGYDAIGGTMTATNNDNTAIGNYSMDAGMTNSSANVAVGNGALGSATAITSCVAIGKGAFANVSTIVQAVAIGEGALGGAESADGSVAVGYSSMYNTTGAKNTALGYQSANTVTSGTENTVVGYDADASASGAVNQTVIGSETTGVADNSVTLGNADVTDVYMAQDKGAKVHCLGIDIQESSLSTADSYRGFYHIVTKTGGDSNTGDDYQGIYNQMNWNQSDTYGVLGGIYNSATMTTGATGSSTLVGLQNQTTQTNGNCNNLYGISNRVDIDDGTIDEDVNGIYNVIDKDGGAIAGNVSGYYTDINLSATGSIDFVFGYQTYIDCDESPQRIYGNYLNIQGSGTGSAGTDFFQLFFDDENDDIVHQITYPDGVATFDSGDFSGAPDYAEYFESKDGKPIAIGSTVKLDGDKIVACSDGDTPMGVVRPKSAPSVVSNAKTTTYHAKYLTTDYDEIILEDFKKKKWEEEVSKDVYEKGLKEKVKGITYVEVDKKYYKKYSFHSDRIPSDLTIPEDAIEIESKRKRKKLNPNYDPTKEYKNRTERDEWCLIGLLGQIPITKGQPVASNWIKMKDVSDKVEMYFVK